MLLTPNNDVLAPPTPAGRLPITEGCLAAFSRNIAGGLRQLHRTHGPIAALEDRGQRIVFLFHPTYNRQVLSDTTTYQACFFGIRGPKRSPQRRITSGLLAMNGEQHRRNRRLVKEPFGLKAIATYRPAVEQLAGEMLAPWRPGDVRDINREMTRYLLKVTSSILFGLDEPHLAYEIGEQVADWVTMLHELGIGALVPHDQFSARYEDLLEFAGGLESRLMEMIRQRRADAAHRHDVLSILVRTHDQQGGLSDEELVGQACVLFAAAHMTTSHSLTWTLFLIAQHPEVARQLWQEAESLGGAPVDPNHSLTSRVIRESMRVLPASAYSQRITDTRVDLGPFDLPRGTPIVFTPLITHKLEEFYPEPDRFLPERWLTHKPGAYEYIPFGGGPRQCIGGPLAMEILRTTLPAIARRFRLTVEPGADINAEVLGTMLNPTPTVPMEIAPAGDGYQWSPVAGNIHEFVDLAHTRPV